MSENLLKVRDDSLSIQGSQEYTAESRSFPLGKKLLQEGKSTGSTYRGYGNIRATIYQSKELYAGRYSKLVTSNKTVLPQ